jgi:hypothetical protein
MDKKNLQIALLNELAKYVGAFGFVTKVNGQSFYREISDVALLNRQRYAFHVSFIEHRNDFDITADVAIRLHALEDLLNEYKTYLSKAEKKKTFSLGVELGNFSQGHPSRWTIARSDEVAPVANSIMDTFSSIGIPYLEKYSDLHVMLDIFSRDDKEACLHSPFLHERALRALGLAFLMKDREPFEQIALSKTALLSARNDLGLPLFIKIRDTLFARLGPKR